MYFVLMFVDESWNDSLSVITDWCIENESVKGEGVIVYERERNLHTDHI